VGISYPRLVKEPYSGLLALLRNRTLRTAARACTVAVALAASRGTAQTYSVLHHFQGDDGKWPWAGLVESSNVLYGTTYGTFYAPGSDNLGEVFKVNKDGSGFAVLRQFTGDDGSRPMGRLVLSGNTLYGTTAYAGSAGYGFGNIFKIDTAGTGFTVLTNFQGDPDTAYPQCGLLLAGSTLYGTAAGRDSYPGHAPGAVYSINTDGTGYTILKRFSGPDGFSPQASLARFGTFLFGTTLGGGTAGYGTLFWMTADGSSFRVLHNFLGGQDGRGPEAELLFVGVTLFGTTWGGGAFNQGTIFRINLDGTGYQVIKSLSWDEDGAFPQTGLIQYGGTLLGVARGGGRFGAGTIFKLGFDGAGFTKLWDFPGQMNGANPYADMLLSGTTLYGTTVNSPTASGSGGIGVVYRFDLVPTATTPFAQTAEAGSSPRIRLPNTEAVPTSYQWFLNATNPVAGATNANLLLSSVQPFQTGAYTCTVSNEFGATNSSPAVLSIIPPVPRRSVPALSLAGQPASTVAVDYADTLEGGGTWATLSSPTFASPSQFVFDTSSQLPPQRFYRARTTGTTNPPSVALSMAQEITITGTPSQALRLDYISPIGPTDNWTTLATVTLTNSSQPYFDVTAPAQQPRLYRIVP
jgi:uncharacterized repeat protein (TIGR03803 family)